MWGIADYVVTIATILVPLASLRYEDALMLPKDARTAAHGYLLAVIMVVITTALLTAVIAFFPPIVSFFDEKGMRVWAFFIPLGLFANRMAKITEL